MRFRKPARAVIKGYPGFSYDAYTHASFYNRRNHELAICDLSRCLGSVKFQKCEAGIYFARINQVRAGDLQSTRFLYPRTAWTFFRVPPPTMYPDDLLAEGKRVLSRSKRCICRNHSPGERLSAARTRAAPGFSSSHSFAVPSAPALKKRMARHQPRARHSGTRTRYSFSFSSFPSNRMM